MASNSIPKYDNEPFRVLNRLEDFLNYDGHGILEACEITYWGLNEHTRAVVEYIFNCEFQAI